MNEPEAQWSDQLRQATKEAIEELAVMPNGDDVCFKHIKSGYGVIALADLIAGKLRLTNRKMGEETVFANADALIRAGWTLD